MVTAITTKKNIAVNRVQGDLEFTAEIEHDRVIDSWSRGTMYRGFENMLRGRGAMDGLVLTPRVCGICGIAHLFAAVKALEMIAKVKPPNNAVLIRNIVLLAEQIQNDIRHSILIYHKDFLNKAYKGRQMYQEAVRRYEAFHGSSVIETLRMTKKILEIVAIFGGQWPHTSFMVPGGITGKPGFNDLVSCRYIVDLFRSWYEKQILGCTIERWSEVKSESDLQRWMNEEEAHFNSDLGFFIRFSHLVHLHTIGKGYDNFICFGQDQFPENDVPESDLYCFTSGVITSNKHSDFHQEEVTEHVTHSHFKDYLDGKHPFDGETQPHVTRYESVKYSFTKAPRYARWPCETGPLSQMLVNRNPLFEDLVRQHGSSAYVRQLARIIRPSLHLPILQYWLDSIDPQAPYFLRAGTIPDGEGYGLLEASRGALGHWVKIKNSKIRHYQIITPTAWNGSPRDFEARRGPWEEAVVGTHLQDPENPIEIEHIIRSFDPCQVCSVHTARKH